MNTYFPFTPHAFRYELHKEMHLSAAHFIPAESAGKCQRIHGHTYQIDLMIVGDELDANGFLIDFKLLKSIVHDRYDHTLLNEHPEFRVLHPTTEVMAKTIYTFIQEYLDGTSNKPSCLQVIVRETPTSYVVYRPKK
ncbi:6-carboxytetrahydropterin synthase QueD [Paenibacillus whitsoniae]|uniref:6-carboxy-5,6,7,8-tetrahydropterin synthase n=1 Tax=Paenibacillus whitsoniae TaxID=2496558 RepID=A0A430JIZ9_9BACL|nr:6-carboxytetrahydropterin synthase QueD [Paenibacillus whitsoniae]RTE11025.1 6-carboxytetrahydropterin synthase QueD [Paenibacillus whitsoniae]